MKAEDKLKLVSDYVQAIRNFVEEWELNSFDSASTTEATGKIKVLDAIIKFMADLEKGEK